MEKITKFISYNRFIVIGPVIAIMLWFYATSCTPLTKDPIQADRFVNTIELQQSFAAWQTRQQQVSALFEIAGEDLKQQAENNLKIQDFIMNLATGGVSDLPGLLKLLIGGGALGAIGDNVRKRGLIQGLKKNNKA